MEATPKTDAAWFTTKGQIVIPVWLRKQFQIEDGTKVVVEATPDGILLRPVTAALIKRGRGLAKRKSDGKAGKASWQSWAEHKSGEIALEEAKYARSTGGPR